MKTKLLPVLCCFTSLPLLAQEAKDPFKQPEAAPAAAPATTDDATRPVNIIIQQETYTLPRLDALMLLSAGLSDDGLHEAILRKVQEKAATLDKFILIRTKSGQRARVEQTDEFPYATDLDPPQVPQTLTLVDAAGIAALSGVKSLTPAVPPAPTPTPPPDKAAAGDGVERKFPASPSNAGIGLQTTTTPTTFTFKSMGDTLEVDPVLGEDGVTIDLTLAPESVRFLGYNNYGDGRQPDFQAQRYNTSVTGTSGKPIFVGTRSKACRSGVGKGNAEENITLDFVIPWAAKIPPVKNPPPPSPEGGSVDPHAETEMTEAQVKFAASLAAKRYRFQWELISLPKDAAFALTHAAPDDPSIYGKLREMIQAKTANLESLQSIRTRSGQRAKIEEIDEHPYPTDFDPPQVPQTLTIADQRTLDIFHNEGGSNAPPSAARLAPVNGGFGIITQTTATTFSVRNVGETLELEPVIGEDGATVDMTLAPEKIRFLTNIQYQECVQPIFEVQKLMTSVTLRINVPMLVGTMSRPVNTGVKDGNMEDRIWLAFMTVFDQ